MSHEDLHNLQTNFYNMIYNATDEKGLKKNISNEQKKVRLWIHHINTYESIINYLKQVFRATCIYIGREKFRKVALEYINFYPLRTPILSKYGEFFSSFLSKKNINLFAVELSSFEWLLSRAFYGSRNSPSLPLSVLLQYNPDIQPDLFLTFHPNIFLLNCKSNIESFWRKQVDFGSKDNNFTQKSIETYFVIFSNKEDVQYKKITISSFHFLRSLMKGFTFQEALGVALSYENDFDFQKEISLVFDLQFVSLVQQKKRNSICS